jgi:hypothetical protein
MAEAQGIYINEEMEAFMGIYMRRGFLKRAARNTV